MISKNQLENPEFIEPLVGNSVAIMILHERSISDETHSKHSPLHLWHGRYMAAEGTTQRRLTWLLRFDASGSGLLKFARALLVSLRARRHWRCAGR